MLVRMTPDGKRLGKARINAVCSVAAHTHVDLVLVDFTDRGYCCP